jgi:propanol-preferring alcohol dehydrogenase
VSTAPARAALLDAPVPQIGAPALRLVDRAGVAEPRGHDVVVEVTCCALCRTDLQIARGDLAARTLPVVPGHQIVGHVVEAGPQAELAAGTMVGVAWLAGACGTCDKCRRGRENLCRSATFTGWDRDGGFATHALVDARFAHPLPDGLAPEQAAPLLCGGAIGYRSLRVSGIEPGGRLGLYGFGASATAVVQIARHWGCDVFVCTRSVAEQQRALDLGAAWAGGYDDTPPVPLDAAITFAPSGDVVVRALEHVDRGGAVAVNAIHLDRIPSFRYDLLWWERSIRSVANVARDDVRAVLALAEEIPLVTHRQTYPLDDVNVALCDLEAGRVRGAAVIDLAGGQGQEPETGP